MSTDRPDSAVHIRLDQFLKFMGITSTGGQAKLRIQGGEVRVNGETELHRGRTLGSEDVVEVDGKSLPVGPSLRSSRPSSGDER